MPFGKAVGEGFVNPVISKLTVGTPPNVQIELLSLAGVGALIIIFNNPSFSNGELAGDVQGNFAQVFFNGPHNMAAGHGDFAGIVINSSDGASSANLSIEYTDTGGVPHAEITVDSAGVHIPQPLQLSGAGSTLPLAHDANFPVSGAATLGTVIAALNALYNDLVSGKVFAS